MKLDHKKAALWVCGLAALASILVFRAERKVPEPTPPPALEQPAHKSVEPMVNEPAPAVAPAPVPVPHVTVPVTPPKPTVVKPPAVKAPVPKAVAPKCAPCGAPARPKPKFKKAVAVPVEQRRHTSRCSLVPSEAYAHSTSLVMASASGRGLTPEQMSTLRWCIGG